MYDCMRALEARFAPKPNHKRRQELEIKRQEVAALLDKQGQKKLLNTSEGNQPPQKLRRGADECG